MANILSKIHINLKTLTLLAVVALAGSYPAGSEYADSSWTILGMPDGVGVHYAYGDAKTYPSPLQLEEARTIFESYGNGDAKTYPSPLQQQRDGVLLDAIMCNMPNELYIKESSVPVCITASTYERLLVYGLDLVPYDVYAAADTMMDIFTIGTIVPLTGGAAGYGQSILTASELAVSDFNALLEERGETWRLEMESLDSMTSNDGQMDSLIALNEQGIKIINGPSIDIFDQDSLDYANDNGMLLISCCSVAVSYSIAGDAMFRMGADQSKHGHALAELMHDEKITAMVTAGRDAPWITDLLDSATKRFLELGGGGMVAESHILYDVSGEFDDSTMQALADTVTNLESHRDQRIGVLFVGFEESYDFLEMASAYEALGNVRWFGADINTIIHDNQDGLDFAETVGLMSVQPTVAENDINARVLEHISVAIGRTPEVYATLAYDAVQLIGHAIADIQGDSVSDVAEAIPRVAQGYAGASGDPISFNDAGDRDSMTYAAWIVKDGAWIVKEILTPDDASAATPESEPGSDTWIEQESDALNDPASSTGSGIMPQSRESKMGELMASSDLGFAVGGAKDIDNFRANIDAGFLPLHTDITHEGLFYDYYFDTGAASECEELFCPSYLTAVSADPFSGDDQYYLSVGLNSGLKEADFERKNLNLVIVMDVSGSMKSPFDQYHYDLQGSPTPRGDAGDDSNRSKMETANESVVGLLDHLTDDDRLGVVLFESTAHVAKPLESMGDTDRERLARNILGIYADGGTNLESGITLGASLFDDVLESDHAGYENRIIFLTDAMPNTGSTGQNQLFNLIEWSAEKQIYTTVIGIGVDFNTELIERITDVRGANYYSVHSPSEFLERMSDEFELMVTPLVFDLSLRLDADGYDVLDVYGVPESDSFTGNLIHVNTLFPSRIQDGETRGGIILVKLARESDAGMLELRASYLDRDGQIRSSSTTVVNIDDEAHYQTSGIQKGILLSRYADLMKTWAYDERSSHAGTVHSSEYLYSDGLHVPGRVNVSLGQWERQSVPLTVSSDYAAAIAEFSVYFSQEAESIGDPALLQEAAVMSALLFETLQNSTDTWSPRPP